MKPAEDRDRDDLSADLGDRPRSGDRYPLPQTLMGPSAIEVDLDVLLQNATQLSLADYDHVVEALPAHRTKKAFTDGVRIGGARRDLHNLDLSALGHGGEPFPELVIVVSDEYFGPSPYGVASWSCWAAQASVGQRVTLK